MSCASTGATIHYTIDGTVPTQASPSLLASGLIELAQSAYMDEADTLYDSARAEPLRALLQDIISALLRWRAASA